MATTNRDGMTRDETGVAVGRFLKSKLVVEGGGNGYEKC